MNFQQISKKLQTLKHLAFFPNKHMDIENLFYEVYEDFVYLENNHNYIYLIQKMELSLQQEDWRKHRQSFLINIEVLFMILPDEHIGSSYELPILPKREKMNKYDARRTMYLSSGPVLGLVVGEGV
jgi:hypothetical protein